MEVVDQVSPEDSKEIFVVYGYDLAISEDAHSLSYIIEPKREYPFLMLDTNSYSNSKSTKSSSSEGKIRKETYNWLNDYFALQRDARQTYVVSPRTQLNHSGKEGSSLEDGERLVVQQMAEERWFDKQLSLDVKDFIGKMNVCYFSGEDYIERNEAEVIQKITSHPGYQIIQENSTGFLKRYSNQLLQDQNLNDKTMSIPHNN